MKRTPLKRTSRLSPVSKRKKARSGVAGKLGRVRLTGPALAALRVSCFERDGFKCRCKYPEPGCGDICDWLYDDMAHIVSRGRGGSDVLENVLTMKHDHHMATHNCGGKPLPRKV